MSTTDSRPARARATPIGVSPAGPDSLGGLRTYDAQCGAAAEGQDSPQAKVHPPPKALSPAGSKTSRSQSTTDTHSADAAADDLPGGHAPVDTHMSRAAGEWSQ